MKLFITSLVAACGALAGCVGIPVVEPGVYVSGTISSTSRNPPPRAYPYEERRYRHWRDHDGDGVPNEYDRRPHNPYRY